MISNSTENPQLVLYRNLLERTPKVTLLKETDYIYTTIYAIKI